MSRDGGPVMQGMIAPTWPRRILGVISAAELSGCSDGLFDPQGPIAIAEKTILYDSLAIMAAIILPTVGATLSFVWWFRSANKRAHYLPDWQYSGRIELIAWSIPAMTILLLASVGWIGAHELDPFKPLAGSGKPLRIQVVSLDWKWLFILPDQGIADVNRVIVPVATPLSLELTSSGVMNAFLVPRLGSQIAVMPHMVTRLHLLADRPGTYAGLSTQFSGEGFATMSFTVEALPPDRFEHDVAAIRGQGRPLDPDTYADLAAPSQAVAPYAYGAVSPGLFETILRSELRRER
ncbi:MAG TPA: cytochrome ubiquinol oxidase subunit II [Rhodospirillaceae bacterium]|nr:cytochrome ubiquinol oxidase subunit II [Rhodospirillaceae bacterium]